MAACTASSGVSGASRRLCRVLLLRARCSCAFQLFFQQLLLIQIGVIAAASEEFVVRAALDDAAFAEDDNLVGVLHGGSAVRNQNGGAAVHDAAQARKNALFGLRVDAGEGIVENEDARVTDYGAGDGGALLLSTGQSDAALADNRFVFMGEALDVGIEAGDFGGLADLVEIVVGQTEGDVAADGFAKEVGVLRDVADGAAQGVDGPFADGAAVDEDFAFWGFPEAGDEGGEGGLAAAGGADDSERGACRNFQADVAKNGMRPTAVGAVALGGAIAGNVSGEGESEVAKFDFAGDGGVRRDLHEAVVDLRLRAQDVIQAAHGGGAALENVGDPAEGDHGPDQKAEIAVERDQGTEGDLAAKKLMAALPEDDEEGSADERLKRRHEHAPGADELDIAGDVLAIGLVEAADFGFFLGVGADDADAGKIFLDFCGKTGESGLNGFVEIVDDFAEMADGDGYDGHGQEHPKRQGGRKARHDDDGEDHGHDRLTGVHDAGAENHADVVEVVGGAGH